MSASNTPVREVPSPSGKYKAVVFERSAGATTSFSTQISIIRSSGKLKNEPGNIFIADCDHGKAPSASWGGPEVRVKWIDDDTLSITHNSEARIFKSEKKYLTCKMKYFSEESGRAIKTPTE